METASPKPPGRRATRRAERRRRLKLVLSAIAALVAVTIFVGYATDFGRTLVNRLPFTTMDIAADDPLQIGDGTSVPEDAAIVDGKAVPKGIKASAVDTDALSDEQYPFKHVDQTVVNPDGSPGARHFEHLTPLMEIGPSGGLQKDMRIGLKLSRAVTPEEAKAMVIISNQSHQPGGEELLYPRLTDDSNADNRLAPELSPDGWYVYVTVQHLSWFRVSIPILDDFRNTLKDVLTLITNHSALAEADMPKCDREADAKKDGYLMVVTGSSDTLLSCLGLAKDGKTPQVKFSNNRRYGVAVFTNGMKKVPGGAFKQLQDALNLDILMPRNEATYDVEELKSGGTATVNVSASHVTNLVSAAWTYFNVLMLVAAKGKKLDPAQIRTLSEEAFEGLLMARECLTKIGDKNVGAVELLSACFKPDQLEKAFQKMGFGKTGLILAVIGMILSEADTNRALANAFTDSRNGRDKQTLTVRKSTGIDKRFVGTWRQHNGTQTQTLVIRQDGKAHVELESTDPAVALDPLGHLFSTDMTLTPAGSNSVIVTYGEPQFSEDTIDDPSLIRAGDKAKLTIGPDGVLRHEFQGRLSHLNGQNIEMGYPGLAAYCRDDGRPIAGCSAS